MRINSLLKVCAFMFVINLWIFLAFMVWLGSFDD